MNKELDEAWTTIYHYNEEIIHDMGSEYVENPLKEELDIVNNALLELKAIKEAKPDKVLETLKDMLIGNGINDTINDYVDNLILPIKQALQRLESIDNAKPSEALKFLEKLLEGYSKGMAGRSYYDTIKQALLKAQEQEKVLEIIKEKRVNVEWFWNDFIDNGFGYHYYLEKWYKYQNTDKQKLTEEEFDLLKRWLG